MDSETIVLKDGYLINGTGKPGGRADVVLEDGKIKSIGAEASANTSGSEVVDASELVVAPGFVDIHSHSDLSLLADGRGLSKIYQGVTTEVVGNCSLSPAPVSETNRAELRRTFSYLEAGVDWEWTAYEEYLERLRSAEFAPNLCPLVGYGAIRAAVKGFSREEMTGGELAEAQRLLAQCLEAGARGLSTGLVYIPCCYATYRELVAMARVVKEYGGLWATHMRNEGHRLLEAVEETIKVVQASGVRTEISHFKAAGESNWGLVKEAVEKVYSAREAGWEIGYDVYPYLVGSTYLSALLPRWAREGGREKLVNILADDQNRIQLKKALEEGSEDWPGYPGPGTLRPEKITISSVNSEKNEQHVGKTIVDVAETRGVDSWDCFFDLLQEEKGEIIGLYEYMDEADVEYLYSTPFAAVGSDGLAIPPEGHWLKSKPHPRYYGTFPRFLRKYVREKKLLNLEEAIHRITALPADRLGLENRGRVLEGNQADLVLFHPDEITDTATYDSPHQLARGVKYLFVNGEPVIYNEEVESETAGQVLTSI